MSVSRFIFSAGASLFRRHTEPLPSISFLRLAKSLPLQPLRFLTTSSTAAGIDTITADSVAESIDSNRHPWPEWVTFIDRLKTRGYFLKTTPEGDTSGGDSVIDYKDMNVLKDACLSFARDRYDVFKSLSLTEMETVVEVGCPNLFRKAVNSAKRLRAHVQLDEGEVCSTCNLRGSCDRAYVIVKESEAAARTVDIVRILLFYALDPLVISGENKPPGRILVEASARKLLSELIELSDTNPDPALPKPAAKSPRKKEQSVNTTDDELPQDVKMNRGDWMCPSCNFLNFARNTQCLKCKEDAPKRVGGDDAEMKKGDWTCPACNFMNFSRNIRCLKCKTEGPKRLSTDQVEMKKGDWNCSQCGFMNFASNKKCLRCRESRPQRQLEPGEWECPSCDFLNYRRNKVCKRCNRDHPSKAASDYEDQVWTRPQ